jgi:hypothetical protein
MRILAVGALAITMFGMPVLPVDANEPVVAEKAGSTYTLAMEGMT